MEAIVFAADPIMWKSQEPVWVEQWPLTKEKLLVAKTLIFEQLELGHVLVINIIEKNRERREEREIIGK